LPKLQGTSTIGGEEIAMLHIFRLQQLEPRFLLSFYNLPDPFGEQAFIHGSSVDHAQTPSISGPTDSIHLGHMVFEILPSPLPEEFAPILIHLGMHGFW
jgi:hypothetical protein